MSYPSLQSIHFSLEVTMDSRRFRYCPFCGQTLQRPEGDKVGTPRCAKCEHSFYSSPHPTVSAVIVDGGEERVLLTRRNIEPFKGYWDIPGGFLELGESLQDGLRREIHEELGVEIQIRSVLGSYSDTYGQDGTPTINIFYLATILEGRVVAGSDVSEFRWFHQQDIPETIAFDTGRLALHAWIKQTNTRRLQK